MAHIHPTAQVAEGAKLAADVSVGPYCIVGPHVTLESGTILQSHVSVSGHTTLAKSVMVHPFACLGEPPQHMRHQGEPTRLWVGPRTVIREHVTMHTGTVLGRGETIVGADGYFMVASHVGHDCILGDGIILNNNVALGGHVSIGDRAIVGGNSAVHQFCRIGEGAMIGGMSGIEHDIIPFALAKGDRARLSGLNLVGLKRRGWTKEAIRDVRAAYRLLFESEGSMAARKDAVLAEYASHPACAPLLAFLKAESHRPLCQPAGAGDGD